MGRFFAAALGVVALLGVIAGAAPARTELGSNARGDRVLARGVLAQHSRPLFAAVRPAASDFSPLPAVGPRGYAEQIETTVDESGAAVMSWLSYPPDPDGSPRAWAAASRPDGSFGPAVRLPSVKDATQVLLAGNARGDAIVAWTSLRGLTKLSYRPAGGPFAPAQTIGGRTRSLIGLTLDPRGEAVLVRQYEDRRRLDETAVAHTRGVDGKISAGRVVAGVPAYGTSVEFASSQTGGAIIAWYGRKGLRAVERAPGQDFGAPFTVTASGYTAVRDLALAPSGAAAVVVGDRTDVRVAVREPRGAFGRLQRVGTRSDFETARVAVNDRGDVATAWGDEGLRAVAAYRSAGAPSWRQLELAPARPGAPGVSVQPSVAIDGAGRATAAWEESDGATVRTLTRDFDDAGMSDPVLVDSLPSYVQEGPASACRGDRPVRRNAVAALFRRGIVLYGCLFGRGKRVPLGDDNIYPPRTMALTGPLAAYASDYDEDRVQSTTLRVKDLRDEGSGINRSTALEQHSDTGQLATTRLRSDGAIAWISCPTRHASLGRLSPGCEHGGRGARVKHLYAWGAARREPRLVDSGRGIDPGSLVLNGSTLTWRNGKRDRSTTMR